MDLDVLYKKDTIFWLQKGSANKAENINHNENCPKQIVYIKYENMC